MDRIVTYAEIWYHTKNVLTGIVLTILIITFIAGCITAPEPEVVQASAPTALPACDDIVWPDDPIAPARLDCEGFSYELPPGTHVWMYSTSEEFLQVIP